LDDVFDFIDSTHMMNQAYDCLIHHQLIDTNYIYGPVLDLKLIGFHTEDYYGGLPFYCFAIMKGMTSIGKITLRLGYQRETRIHGHVGYQIDEPHRGHQYAYYALEMIKELAKAHGYRKLLLTTEASNESSIRIVMKSHGKLIDPNVMIPEDHIYYILGKRSLYLYEIEL
jgi:RimJ/RimL family protein N-acetyltransferase